MLFIFHVTHSDWINILFLVILARSQYSFAMFVFHFFQKFSEMEVTAIWKITFLRTMLNLRKNYYQEVMNVRTKKIARLLYKETDVDKHIRNISSYELSFFQKLVLCRGLKFTIPKYASPNDVKASSEKAHWSLEPHWDDDNLKELSATTPRSVALNYMYIQHNGPKSPRHSWGLSNS